MVSLKDYRCGASAAVSDMQRARQFYEGVLGLVPGTDTGDNVGYPCGGDTQINVYLSPNAGTCDVHDRRLRRRRHRRRSSRSSPSRA